jgi:hypothetical protein
MSAPQPGSIFGPMSKPELELKLRQIIPPAQPAPTVGRIVHYYPSSFLRPSPRAAVITAVDEHGVVCMEVFGEEEAALRFRHNVPFATVASPGCWSWPPR